MNVQHSPTRTGAMAAGAAFLLWGLFPVYWKALGAVPALEILCHRIVWSAVCTGLVLAVVGRLGEVRAAMASRRSVAFLLASSVLVSLNWFLYIWAVNSGQVVEASLGYYITPLVNVLLGFLFCGERLGRVQLISVGLAAVGVANLVWDYGQFPWLAVSLALTFASYGLVRKKVQVESLPGLFFETLLLGVAATAWLVHEGLAGGGAFLHLGLSVDVLLVGAGVVTSAPLLMFTFGARRIRMSTLGILQYLAPTCMFVLGVFVYGETFTRAHLVTFLFIWAGVALYTGHSLAAARRHSRLTKRGTGAA